MDDPTETVSALVEDLEDAMDALDSFAPHVQGEAWYKRLADLLEDNFQQELKRSQGAGVTRH